jgi:hypothetical protein
MSNEAMHALSRMLAAAPRLDRAGRLASLLLRTN